MGFRTQRSPNIRRAYSAVDRFCTSSLFTLQRRKCFKSPHSRFSVRIPIADGHSATVFVRIFSVRLSAEPVARNVPPSNPNTLEQYRLSPGTDYDAVCSSEIHPLSRGINFALLGHRTAYRRLVRRAYSLSAVYVYVCSNQETVVFSHKNIMRSVSQAFERDDIQRSVL